MKKKKKTTRSKKEQMKKKKNKTRRSKKEQMKKRDKSSIVCKRPSCLNELPDYLLVEIISLLPIEEAVRTGVLSTRWKNLWKNTYNIVHLMRHFRLSPQQQSNFISFVDHTVMQCLCPKTFSFRATQLFDQVHIHSLHNLYDIWLQRVYSRKVESLTANIWRFSYVPQEWFYHNSTLVKLEIGYWNIIIPGQVVSWTLLKSLTLHRVTIGDEEIAIILSGCPVLENLDLSDVKVNSLNIMSPCMVKLSVTYKDTDMDWGSLEINAPWLQFLNLYDWFGHVAVQLVDVSSLVHANLDIDNEDDLRLDVATKLLEKVQHVQELTIGRYFISALSLLKLSGKQCPSFNCKRLTFIICVYKHELPGISYVLQSSPHLETLVIVVRKWWEEDIHYHINEITDFEGAVYFSTENGDFDFPHLRSIEITYHGEKDPTFVEQENFVFELVEYILKKAPALKNMVIAQQEDFCKCSRNWALENMSMLSDKLSDFFLNRKLVVEWKVGKNHVELIF